METVPWYVWPVRWCLMSWNVLADAYIRPEYHRAVEPELLESGARTAAIAELVTDSEADIACLQEVEPSLLHVLAGWEVHRVPKRGKPDSIHMNSASPLSRRPSVPYQ